MKNIFFFNVTAHEKNLPYFCYGAAADYEQEDVIKPNGFQWFQINICLSGSGTLFLNNLEIQVKKGECLIIYPNIPYKYIPGKDGLIVSWVSFDGFHVSSMLNFIGIKMSGVYKFLEPEFVSASIKEMVNFGKLSISDQGYAGSRVLYNLLLSFKETLISSSMGQNESQYKKIKPAIDFMNVNLKKQIGIEDIADSINVTPQHFCLLFKSVMNQRPFEYLNSLRINNAKNLLIHRKDLTINQIAMMSGYINHSYFCHLFKMQERVTPNQFRLLYL